MKKIKKDYKKCTDKEIVHIFVTEIIEPYIEQSNENITIDHLIKSLTVVGKINKDSRDYKLKKNQFKIDKFNSEIEDISYDGEPEI